MARMRLGMARISAAEVKPNRAWRMVSVNSSASESRGTSPTLGRHWRRSGCMTSSVSWIVT